MKNKKRLIIQTKNRKISGITLIALIVTIVVMLIIAGISIGMINRRK